MHVLALLLFVWQQPVAGLELWTGTAWRAWRTWQDGAPASRDAALWNAIVWTDSADGIRVGEFEVRVAGGALRNDIAVVELDPRRFRFSLLPTPPAARRTASEVVSDSSIVFVSNTGLFRPDGTPQGLVLLDGAQRSASAGWLDVVVAIVDGELAVTDVAGARQLPAGASAFQVLPWLVREGQVVLGTSSGIRLSRTHRDRRITLCVGTDGRLRFALSNFRFLGQRAGRVPVGLTIPEQAMVAAALGCRDAVALDGGISAQLAVRTSALHRMPGWRRVPLFLVARRR